MMDFQQKVNSAEIIPQYGSEYIHIGMSVAKLMDILWNNYARHGEQYSEGYCMFYHITLKHSIRVSIEIIKQVVYRIEYLGDFKGNYKGIGIGSTIQELLAVRRDVYFHDEYILVGNYPSDLIIQINNQQRIIHSLADVNENKIISIIVENKGLL